MKAEQAAHEVPDVDLLLDRLEALREAHDRRVVLGVAGSPGAGKTSLVLAVLAAAAGRPTLAGRLAHVPMDGFHLPNAELDRLGRRDRKGAPDTFDAPGYAAVLAGFVRDAGLDDIKIMVGGAPVTQGFCDEIGADGYSQDAASAVDLALRLVEPA